MTCFQTLVVPNKLRKYDLYIVLQTLTALCALPVALLAGLAFAIMSCLHIWMVHPCLRQVSPQ